MGQNQVIASAMIRPCTSNQVDSESSPSFFFPHQEAERKHLPPTAVTVDTPKRGRAANTGQIHRVILRFPSLLFNISATCSLILSEDQRHGLTCVLQMPLLRVCVFYNVMSPTGERINHIFSGKLFPFNYINVP